MEISLSSIEDTQNFGKKLARALPVGSVVALYGNLGAGKTTLSQGFAKGLHIHEHVGSPTFKLVGEYEGDPHKLYHIDCYRIQKSLDFLAIGGEEYLHPIDGVTLIEWAGNIEELLPLNTIKVKLERINETPDKRFLTANYKEDLI